MRSIEIKYSNFDFTNSAYEAAKNAAHIASDEIISAIQSKDPLYKIFSIQYSLEQAKLVESYAQEINENFTDLIVIGMGGAVLNPETLISLCSTKTNTIKIHFLSNTDPIFLGNLLSRIELKNCAILAISNSGQTLETISLVGVIIAEFIKKEITPIGKHFYFITNLHSGSLKNVANKIDATLIEHTANISGRYSGLTNVTTLPAQIAGINVQEYIAGANSVLEDFYNNKSTSQAALSASAIYSMQKPISVSLGYLQQFNVFLEWYSQIIAESLGKDGKGITPIKGLGPNDQHSMLQLYLEGPQDKLYSLFCTKNNHTILSTANFQELGYIANKNLDDINRANFDATLSALNKIGAPTRSIILNALSARTIGELVMHSMLEVIILGHMMQLNPFNQPGVELIKTESTRIIQKA
ncbi:MAG: hypothetical protein NWP91_01655 [Rickettsiaceae bacterium]|nr:hypothetical protein [Rickettsiaceae bacterium]MDP5020423.1 hypothetical protein [Rickettsiaceae bacterium]